MVVSELAAATMIAVCGLKNSYRIILRGERLVRRKIRRPSPIVDGYDSFPRFFIRRVFRAGLEIAMRWEGRAKNAAQIARDARIRARSAQKAVADRVEQVRHRAEDVRTQARDQAARARQRAEDVRSKAHESAERIRETAASARKRAEDVRIRASESAERIREKAAEARQKAEEVREAAVKAKDAAVAAKDRVVEIKDRVRERISTTRTGGPEGVKKIEDGGTAMNRKSDEGGSGGKRLFHSRGLAGAAEPERFLLVRTRLSWR